MYYDFQCLHPITLQGTEPPEPAHRRPANPTPRRDDAGDMPREAGEVKVLLRYFAQKLTFVLIKCNSVLNVLPRLVSIV